MADARVEVRDGRAVVSPFGGDALLPLLATAAASATAAAASAAAAAASAANYFSNLKFIPFEVVAGGTGNIYSVRPMDHSVNLSGLGTQFVGVHEITQANSGGSGSVSMTVLDGDGTVFLPASQFLHANGDGLTVNEHQPPNSVMWKRHPTAFNLRMVELPDLATRRLTRLNLELSNEGKAPTPQRPVKIQRVEDNTWFFGVLPHPSHYVGDRANYKRQSDWTRWIYYNMAEFQQEANGLLVLNGLASQFNGRFDFGANLLFTSVDPSGRTTDTGLSPATNESVLFVMNYANDPSTSHAAGPGHNAMTPDSPGFTVIPTRNDVGTWVITAASQTNPLTLTIPSNTYAVGSKITPQGVQGMTEINGVELTVTVDGGDVLTFGAVNATGYGAFSGHTGGIDFVQPDKRGLAVGDPAFYCDKVVVKSTGVLLDNAGAVTCSYSYADTIEPAAPATVIRQADFDFGDPRVVITPGVTRGVMCHLGLRDVNRMQCIVNGVAQAIQVIDKRDGSATTMGMAEKAYFWSADDPHRQTVLTNLAGYGFSHWEDSGSGYALVAQPAAGYVDNNDYGPKAYMTQAWNSAGKINMAGKKVRARYSYCVINAEPRT